MKRYKQKVLVDYDVLQNIVKNKVNQAVDDILRELGLNHRHWEYEELMDADVYLLRFGGTLIPRFLELNGINKVRDLVSKTKEDISSLPGITQPKKKIEVIQSVLKKHGLKLKDDE